MAFGQQPGSLVNQIVERTAGESELLGERLVRPVMPFEFAARGTQLGFTARQRRRQLLDVVPCLGEFVTVDHGVLHRYRFGFAALASAIGA